MRIKERTLPIATTSSTFTVEVDFTSTFSYMVENMVILVTVPTGLSVQSASPERGTWYPNDLKWLIPSIAQGETLTAEFTFVVDDPAVFPANITFAITDPPPLDVNSEDDSIIYKVYALTCSDLGNTCFEGILPIRRTVKLTVGGLEVNATVEGLGTLVLTNTSQGIYRLTLPSGVRLEKLLVFGDSATTNADDLTIIIDEPNDYDVYLSGEVAQQVNTTEVDKYSAGHLAEYSDSTPGELSTTIQNLVYGTDGFILFLNALYRV